MKRVIAHIVDANGQYTKVERVATSGKAVAKSLREEGYDVLKTESTSIVLTQMEFAKLATTAIGLSESAEIIVNQLAKFVEEVGIPEPEPNENYSENEAIPEDVDGKIKSK